MTLSAKYVPGTGHCNGLTHRQHLTVIPVLTQRHQERVEGRGDSEKVTVKLRPK